MAECLTELPGFDGLKDAEKLCKLYTEEELKDALSGCGMEFSGDEYEGMKYELTKSQKEVIDGYIYAAQKKYDRNNTKQFSIKLNRKTDKDLMEWLEKQPSKQGAIKAALAIAMRKDGNEPVI